MADASDILSPSELAQQIAQMQQQGAPAAQLVDLMKADEHQILEQVQGQRSVRERVRAAVDRRIELIELGPVRRMVHRLDEPLRTDLWRAISTRSFRPSYHSRVQLRERFTEVIDQRYAELREHMGDDAFGSLMEQTRAGDQRRRAITVDEASIVHEAMPADQALDHAAQIRDALGRPVDEKILPLVAALNQWGVRTTNSCEGHLTRGCASPMVHFAAGDAPVVTRLLREAGADDWLTTRASKDLAQLQRSGSITNGQLTPYERERLPERLAADQSSALSLADRLASLQIGDPAKPALSSLADGASLESPGHELGPRHSHGM